MITLSPDFEAKLQEIYAAVPSTICDACGQCCSVGQPQCMAVEAMAQLGALAALDGDRQRYVIERCAANLTSTNAVKPCVFLSEDNKCLIYEWRPLNCRWYGLIPRHLYARVRHSDKRFLEAAARELRVSPKKVPTARQCSRVRLADGTQLSRAQRDEAFGALWVLTARRLAEVAAEWVTRVALSPAGLDPLKFEEHWAILVFGHRRLVPPRLTTEDVVWHLTEHLQKAVLPPAWLFA